MKLPLIDNALFIDNSSLERFTTCPRSANYYIVHKREGNEERTALGFGKRIHEILDARYRFHPNVIPQSELGLGQTGTELLMLQRAETVFRDWTPGEGDYRTYATALDFIRNYNATYPIEAFSVYKLPTGQPAVEVPFALPLCEIEVEGRTIKVMWTGRIDLIYTREGRFYIMDHKTTSMLGPSYFKEFELSSQVFGYVWAVQRLLSVVVDGFCVNALAFRKPTKTGKAFEPIRQIIPIEQALVGEWEHDTQTIVSDLINMDARDDWPKHTKWCVGKYGVCEYADVCRQPPLIRETLLNSNAFRPVTWSPLA